MGFSDNWKCTQKYAHKIPSIYYVRAIVLGIVTNVSIIIGFHIWKYLVNTTLPKRYIRPNNLIKLHHKITQY